MSIKSKNEVTTKVMDPSVLRDFCKDSMFAFQIIGIFTFVLEVDDECFAISTITTFISTPYVTETG